MENIILVKKQYFINFFHPFNKKRISNTLTDLETVFEGNQYDSIFERNNTLP